MITVPRRLPGTRLAWIAVAANLLAAGVFFFSYGSRGVRVGMYHIDLQVYRIGARAWLDGTGLYGLLPATAHGQQLPFTYPPLAAVLAVPLAWLPVAVDGVVVTLTNVLLLYWVLRLILRTLAADSDRAAVVALPLAVLLDPVRVSLVDGQIDILLMAMVVCDTVGPGIPIPGGRSVRGVLVGLAAAVKLTPAVYLLYLAARGRYRQAGVACASFAAFGLLGLLFAPRDSAQYWTNILFRTGRIGGASYASNQSIRGMLARFGLAGGHLRLAWLALGLLAVLMAWYVARRTRGRAADLRALLTVAVAELLVSPVSWVHHWVWLVPGLLLVLFARARRWALPACVAVYLLFAVGPQWLLPHTDGAEKHWRLWQQLVGDSYVWFGFLALAAAVAVERRRGTRGRECSFATI